MRYSAYFEKVSEVADTDPQLAESLLREAESHASQVVPEHLVRCARVWAENLHDNDNTIRCMLEAECRANDCYMFLYLATAHLTYLVTINLAERCFHKAVALAEPEDNLIRLKEFFETFAPDMAERCQQIIFALEQRLKSTENKQIQS